MTVFVSASSNIRAARYKSIGLTLPITNGGLGKQTRLAWARITLRSRSINLALAAARGMAVIGAERKPISGSAGFRFCPQSGHVGALESTGSVAAVVR
jgi:hypothetical protein